MSLLKNSSFKWGVVLLCMILGTWLGIFLQNFRATAAIFANVTDFTFDIRQIDLVMLRFGILFSMRINLGTLIGAVAGILITK